MLDAPYYEEDKLRRQECVEHRKERETPIKQNNNVAKQNKQTSW